MIRACLAIADQLAMRTQATAERAAETGFMRAAFRRRDRVAVGVEEPLGIDRPGDRPFDATLFVGEGRFASERFFGDRAAAIEAGGQKLGEPAREVEDGFGRRLGLGDQLRIAVPANLDAAEQVRLRARHAAEAGWFELGALSEDLGIGPETDRCAATVRGSAFFLQLAGGLAALELLLEELPVARDLDLERFGERIDDRKTDAVQAAGRLIDLAAELAAGVKRREDHLEGGLVLELRVRVDRDAAPIVGHCHRAIGVQRQLDPVRMAGDGLVHRIVEQLGDQVMHRAGVGAADIHARSTPDRLEPFQDFDVLGGVLALAAPIRG